MSAEIGGGRLRRQLPQVGILADEIVHAAHFAVPGAVLPWTADRGNVFEPRNSVGDALELVSVPELPRAAGAFHEKKTMSCGEFVLPRVARERPEVTDKGRDARDRTKKQ